MRCEKRSTWNPHRGRAADDDDDDVGEHPGDDIVDPGGARVANDA